MPYRITTRTTQSTGGIAYNTFHAAGGTAPDAALLAETIQGLFVALQSLRNSSSTTSFDGDAEIFDPVTGQTLGIQPLTPWSSVGSGGGGWSPAGTCLVLRWRTGSYINGRELRGRSYISGLADIGAGLPTVPQSVLNTVNAALGNVVVEEVVSVYGPTTGSIVDVQSANCWNQFGLMRSRRD